MVGEIMLPNGDKKPDQRKNGARLRLDFSDWWKIGGLAVVVILAGGKLNWTVDANCKQISRNTELVNKHDKEIEVLKTMVSTLVENSDYIKNRIDRIYNELP